MRRIFDQSCWTMVYAYQRCKIRSSFALGLTAMLLAAPCARADHAPNYVVPGRPDVPVIINFFDASWGVVEGEWGLYRPGAVSPTVIPAPHVMPRLSATALLSFARRPRL